MNRIIPTGFEGLDKILGGGLPLGRMIEIYGLSGCGKTTLALDIAIEAQKLGSVVYIDTEESFRPEYANARGLSSRSLIVIQPQYKEQVFKIIEGLIKTNEVKLIIIDTMAGLDPVYVRNKIEKFVSYVKQNNTCILYTNQIREKIGQGKVSASGLDLKFYVDIRVLLSKIKTLKKGTKNIGKLIKAKTIKNRLTKPFQETEIRMMYS